MYMLTWPDVGTFNSGLSLSDNIRLSDTHSIHLSAKGSWQQQRINSDEGYHALEIFFPGVERSKRTFMGRVSVSYAWQKNGCRLAAGT